MTSYASLSDFQTYTGQTIDSVLGQLLLDVTTDAIDSMCNRTFQLTRRNEMHYGDGSNTLYVDRYAVQQLNAVHVVMPGALQFDIPVSQLLVEYEIGKIVNYTPLMFQTYGYTSVFPEGIPIQVDYAYGPYEIVPADNGIADGTYTTYSFANQNWFATTPVRVYKNGVELDSLAYTVDYANGKVTLTTAATASDKITADYVAYTVPKDIKLACLLWATAQLNLPKTQAMMLTSRGDSDYKESYGIGEALQAVNDEVHRILASRMRKGVW